MDSKPWYLSKTVWLALVGLLYSIVGAAFSGPEDSIVHSFGEFFHGLDGDKVYAALGLFTLRAGIGKPLAPMTPGK